MFSFSFDFCFVIAYFCALAFSQSQFCASSNHSFDLGQIQFPFLPLAAAVVAGGPVCIFLACLSVVCRMLMSSSSSGGDCITALFVQHLSPKRLALTCAHLVAALFIWHSWSESGGESELMRLDSVFFPSMPALGLSR